MANGMNSSYLRPPGPYPPMPPPPYTPPFGQTFNPIIGRADEAAANSAAANQGGGQAGGGLNFWGLMNPFATASFQGNPLFPGAAATAPRNAQGFRTNLFGQPYGESNMRQPGDPSGRYSLGPGRPMSNYTAWDDPNNMNNPANQPPSNRPMPGDKMTPQRRGMGIAPQQYGAMLNYLMSMGRGGRGPATTNPMVLGQRRNLMLNQLRQPVNPMLQTGPRMINRGRAAGGSADFLSMLQRPDVLQRLKDKYGGGGIQNE